MRKSLVVFLLTVFGASPSHQQPSIGITPRNGVPKTCRRAAKYEFNQCLSRRIGIELDLYEMGPVGVLDEIKQQVA